MKKANFVVTGIIFFLVACAGRVPKPSTEQINSADCGPFPTKYEEIIKGVAADVLLDPYSAVYIFSEPQKGWNNLGDVPIYGWKVCGTINAKNRMGGYVGTKPFYAMINNGRIVTFIHGTYTIPDNFKIGMVAASMAGSSRNLCEE